MLILWHGTDEFTMRERLAALLADPRFALNIERFDGTSAAIETISDAAQALPFLAERRLVVVAGLPKPRRTSTRGGGDDDAAKPAAKVKGKRGTKKPSAAAQAREFAAELAELAAHLPETTTLVVLADEELPAAHPLLAAARAHGQIQNFQPPTGAALEQWIQQRAATEGARITMPATRLLASLAVGQPRLLANEINKLATFAGPGGAIDEAAVQQLVADSRESRVFDLTDALARLGERGAALRLLHDLLAEGQAPLMILAMIARQVRVLLQVKDLAGRGRARPAEIASAAGLAPFLVEKTLAQARRFTLAQLEAAQRATLAVDSALKRSRMAPDLALDLLVTEFGRAAAPAAWEDG